VAASDWPRRFYVKLEKGWSVGIEPRPPGYGMQQLNQQANMKTWKVSSNVLYLKSSLSYMPNRGGPWV
jgi:hypothetical protein